MALFNLVEWHDVYVQGVGADRVTVFAFEDEDLGFVVGLRAAHEDPDVVFDDLWLEDDLAYRGDIAKPVVEMGPGDEEVRGFKLLGSL